MASRFWVGGAGTWDGASTAHWAATSGGGSGSSVPTSSDDVFFDASSGGGTVTVSGTRACKTLTATGFGGTFTGGGLSASGSVNFAGKSWPGAYSQVATGTLTTGGGTLGGTLSIATGGITLTLGDDLVSTAVISIGTGSFDAGNHNVTALSFSDQSAGTLTMGSGTWTMTGATNPWNVTAGSGLTLSAGTSTIKFTDSSATDKDITFDSSDTGTLIYNNVWFSGTGTGKFNIHGSNTFNNFKADSPPHELVFDSGSIQTVTSLTVNGSSAGYITMGPSGSTPWSIICIAGASVTYAIVRHSHAHGGTFVDTYGADAGGNRGWTFVSSFNVPAASDLYFDSGYVYSGLPTQTVEGLNWLIGETLGVVADGADIGDAVVSSAGKLTLPGGHTGSVIAVGLRYESYAETLRAPQTGNQDGSSLGRQMIVHSASADILDTPYLEVGTLEATERIPHADRRTSEGDAYTGMFPVNGIDDKHDNNGVVVFETDRGYPAIVRAIQFAVESEP